MTSAVLRAIRRLGAILAIAAYGACVTTPCAGVPAERPGAPPHAEAVARAHHAGATEFASTPSDARCDCRYNRKAADAGRDRFPGFALGASAPHLAPPLPPLALLAAAAPPPASGPTFEIDRVPIEPLL